MTSCRKLSFNSRRSPILSLNGVVASSQPLASRIGLQILKHGGNAADAAVAVAAALNVTEPSSTGIGGDSFCLYYDAQSRKVSGLNGSGRAPSKLTLDHLCNEGISYPNTIPNCSAHAVTVPGAAACWVDTVEKFGSNKLTMQQILQPAINLAEGGFPVHHIAAEMWKTDAMCLQDPANKYGGDMLLDGQPPEEGDVMNMPHLAQTFKELATHGKDGFYKGRIAKAIVDVVNSHGGVMTLEDLAAHHTTQENPIHINYRGIDVWEMPPNGQGITALMALNILEGFDIKSMGHNSVEYLHVLTEALTLSFADSMWYVADPSKTHVPVKEMIDKDYAAKKRELIHKDRCLESYLRGKPLFKSDTVYFTVVDEHGNACSFINSNYQSFGTGIVPEGCGFTLQNRGLNFSLDPSHPNSLAPCKRPYHTIIPGMATHGDTGELYASFGVMGGFMQPQGHVQVLTNMIDFEMDPQEALDMPRLCIDTSLNSQVCLEEGIPESTITGLKELGHKVKGPIRGHSRSLFGKGQIIAKKKGRANGGRERAVYWAGSDPRADGMAIAY
ncbi:hypothetical protein QZH41_016733 [Actinostola sp. cb2023]|nr:hypothetical protein QZH41_016733 [Actinostola sp. cb2023]